MSRIRFGLVVATALVAASCDKVPLLAPTSSTIVLTVSTTVVPVNGSATVTAAVTEGPGTPVQNGTVVTFTASFGQLDPSEARTENGKATVRFLAGTASGSAKIGAFSGGARVAAADQPEIRIGGAAASRIALRGDPTTIAASGGTSAITALVIDAFGNALPGAPVTFSTDVGQVSPGLSVTDGNGEARTTLTTPRGPATVKAEVGGTAPPPSGGTGGTGGIISATIIIQAVSPSVTIAPPAQGIEANIPATFTITPVAGATNPNPIRSVVINWGDGSPLDNLGAITGATPAVHTYRSPNVYRVTATVTDSQGIVGESSITVNVNGQSSLSVNLLANPNPVSVSNPSSQGLVTFTANVSGGLTGTPAVVAYYWNFGDNGPNSAPTTTGNTTNHRYSVPGNYLATIEVLTTNGQRGFTQIEIRVNP